MIDARDPLAEALREWTNSTFAPGMWRTCGLDEATEAADFRAILARYGLSVVYSKDYLNQTTHMSICGCKVGQACGNVACPHRPQVTSGIGI